MSGRLVKKTYVFWHFFFNWKSSQTVFSMWQNIEHLKVSWSFHVSDILSYIIYICCLLASTTFKRTINVADLCKLQIFETYLHSLFIYNIPPTLQYYSISHGSIAPIIALGVIFVRYVFIIKKIVCTTMFKVRLS